MSEKLEAHPCPPADPTNPDTAIESGYFTDRKKDMEVIWRTVRHGTVMRRPRRLLATAGVSALVAAVLAGVPPTPATAGALGSLRAADPHLVRDGGQWVSLSTNESLSAPDARPCDPNDPVWQKGFAYLPYRVGPDPGHLADCWGGDALPGGPGPWADRPPAVGMWLWAPTEARIGDAWWLFYVARKAGTGQQCIGVAAGDRATGPNWFHAAQPLICPANGWWAIDPEIFYDRRSQAWYLLWDSGPLNIQRFDPTTGTLVGPVRPLLSESHPDLGFDEFRAADGGIQQVIENPTMVRADSGQLWLFFSANQWASGNYATGWALCGGGDDPTAGSGCALVNSFDPSSRYRPWWGWSQRTAPVSGVDASPAMAFPDVPGFGGLSVAVPDPTATGPQPVYATGHMFWGGPSNLRTQLTFRLDTTGTLPALFEADTVAVHGRPNSFGGDLLGPATPSGHPLATRGVPGWGWPAGHDGIFNAVTADGTVVTQGGNTDIADDMVVAGVYDPTASRWTTVRAKTGAGSDTVTPIQDNGTLLHGGAGAWDVQALADGTAVAFTNLFGVSGAYFDRRRVPAEGAWPSFGIIANVGGWRVVGQWTAAQLAVSNPDSDVDARACAPYQGFADGTSLCGGPNEMALLPRSHDLIIALYAGDGRHTSGGLMAVRVTGSGSTYSAKIVGFYQYPDVTDISPPNPARPGNLGIAVKSVEADPTSPAGDERFSVVADIWHADDGDPATGPQGLDPSVTQEFSYNAATGDIRPVSAPFIAGPTPEGTGFRGVHGGAYDRDGNLWAPSNGVVVYAATDGRRKLGGPECPFDPARWSSHPESYTSTLGTRTVWGQTCAPDYDILPAHDTGGGRFFGYFPQLAADAATGTVAAVDTWDTADVFTVRHTGTGRSMSFTIGTALDTGRNLLPRQGPPEQRPAVFDKTGRLWFTVHVWPPSTGYTPPLDHWVISVDAAALFTPPQVLLPSGTGAVATVQAEATATVDTRRGPVRPDGTIPVDAIAHPLPCYDACADDGIAGDGFQVAATTADYQVFAPVAGSYRIAYRVRGTGGAAIEVRTGDTDRTTPVDTGGTWRTVAGPVVTLHSGLNAVRLSPPTGGWYLLNWFTLTRT
jgi:hypothetical protein